MIVEKLISDLKIKPEQFSDPGLAGEEIELAHTREYYRRVLRSALTRSEIRALGIPLHPASVGRALNSVAGTLKAAHVSKRHGLGITIGGGYHHAYADHGEGFCIFNDLAITSRYLLRNKLAKKVLVFDLDVHQGNGTASILQNDADIFTFSMHGSNNYPARKELSDLDVDLPDGTRDEEYLYSLEKAIETILSNFSPDIMLYQAGVDVLETDQLGRLSLSMKGCRQRDEMVFSLCRQLQIPVVITLGGGYSQDVASIVEAHVNTIGTAMEVLS